MTGASSNPAVIQREGYQAYMDGKPMVENPYRWAESPDDVKAWSAGYAMARTDRKKANREKLKQEHQG